MDVAGALALDDRRVVVGDAQRHLDAELFGQIIDERRPAVDRAGGILFGNDGEDELGILGLPVVGARGACNERASGGADQHRATSDHKLSPS